MQTDRRQPIARFIPMMIGLEVIGRLGQRTLGMGWVRCSEAGIQVNDLDIFCIEQSDDGRLRGMGREEDDGEGAAVVLGQGLPSPDQLPDNLQTGLG